MPAESETTTTTEKAAPAQADPGLMELQQRLADLGYDVGTPDGFGGWQTHYAISAFQRVEGLDPTGEYSDEVREAAAGASRPGPMVPGGESTRVEISLDKQVLFLWESGSLSRILPVSTGNGEYYCVDGDCDTAITPTGSFTIGRKYNGLEISPLGELYHPSYFYGGIAIHGSPSVPAYPASHGCVRIPMYASGSFHDQVPTGTAVYVIGDGPSASDVPPPPDDPVRPPPPPELPEPDPDTTTPPSPPDPDPDTNAPPLTAPTSTTLPETSTTTP
ncbi:MAG: L,D-transpeptidase family protein [Actinobacteria bacterium]|nr:L,D-transpeptidase family protein [Actinomycetota bacterium]